MSETSRASVEEKLLRGKVDRLASTNFLYQYDKLVRGDFGLISEDQIRPVTSSRDLQELNQYRDAGRTLLDQLLVVKLNGGLGTSMGLEKAKSLLPAKQGLSFLEISIQQILACRSREQKNIPFLLMNSFRTDPETLLMAKVYPALAEGNRGLPLRFLQNRVPKIVVDSLKPVECPEDPELEWCPPGHGDLYPALYGSGILEQALNAGLRYLFVSNIDNLSATVDSALLGYLAAEKLDFVMEVCRRTAADRKGGHVAEDANGALLLREIGQCPPAELESFQDYHRYRFFNTNSLWLNLESLFETMKERDGILDLPLICNRKRVDPRSEHSPEVFQLETAMGAALRCFPRCSIVEVERSRFTPVKTTNDLLELWSDCFSLSEDYHLVAQRSAESGKLLVDLDPRFFAQIDQFERRFRYGAPSLRQCRSFHVRGDWHFGPEIVCRGEVQLEASNDLMYSIEGGRILSGTITSVEQ